VEWETTESQKFVVGIEVHASDRKNLLRDISEAVADDHVNILGGTIKTSELAAVNTFVVEVPNLAYLNNILNRIRNVPGVNKAFRINREIQ
jgi:GTP pyrophosphokinase